MSLESALDEERREILKLLEGPRNRNAPQSGRTASPRGTRSPVRSMLDVAGDAPSIRHHSIAGTGAGLSQGASRSVSNIKPVRSMLDPTASAPPTQTSFNVPHPASPPPARAAFSANTSPVESHSSGLHRTQSDASSYPPDQGNLPRAERERGPTDPSKFGPNADYQFEMLPSIQAQSMPKRVTQLGKKGGIIPSMASVVHGTDLGGMPLRDRGRHNSTAGIGNSAKHTSRSPSARLGRSASPHTSMLNTNSFNPMPTPGKFVGEGGTVVDLNSAYRRLSNAALARSGGSLSALPVRTGPQHIRADSGEVLSPSGGVRLQKDYYDDAGDLERAVESSDEDNDESGGERSVSENHRGRRKGRRKGLGGTAADLDDSDDSSFIPGSMGSARGPRQAQSLMAAAEEERQSQAKTSKYKVKSLLDPTVTVTGPGGERLQGDKGSVHPSTSFVQSGLNTPMSSDTEADLTDIKRAQRMNISMSAITSTPASHRVIRTVIRGEFSKMQQEAEQGIRRQRTYLVATDLSDEAAHALEWTIGTVLRDGDTLLAVYAVDEEVGTGKTGETEGSVGIGEGASAMRDTAAMVGSLPTHNIDISGHSPLASTINSSSKSPDTRNMSKSEQERYHAVRDISERCVRLLRKTRLQVRVVVEVVHCKSPKHLITEVIDFIEPTLVILGSRGRSALKGVLLGSFSNYLVTKSSIPVMVARKRLRKHSKYKSTNVRLSNNLTNPGKSLASAKID
ncbi:MAG: hypothetical protein M1812_005210 [Candelaria pacifica]|nr:MAG: hypothetical protein M1812_005210 [Candelaria pacifica]